MRISEKKEQALYAAIHDEIMDLRVRQRQDSTINDLDQALYEAVQNIWDEQKKVLNIKDV